MTHHRSIPALLVAVALVGTVAACSDGDTQPAAPVAATVAPTTTAPRTTIPATTAPAANDPTVPASSDTMAPTAEAASAALQAQLDAVVAAGVPGVVALSRDGDHTEIGTAGVADLATGTPTTADTVFRTGSVAKTFVATVLLQLSAEGVLSLDDTVERWLPGMVPGGDAITIRQLLGNRSGLFDFAQDPQVLAPYLAGDLGHVWTPEELVAIATNHPPYFAPGTAALYSNTDYTVAGLIIERATSHTVAEEVGARIIGPLGLTNTSLPDSTDLPPPFAHGYAVDVGMQDVTAISPSLSSFGGNLVSTAADLATFYDALFGGDLLPAQVLAEMMTTTTSTTGEVLGLGLQQLEMPCGTFTGHSGSTPGYKAAAFNEIEHDRQFVILANALTQDDQVGSAAASAAFDQAAMAAACP